MRRRADDWINATHILKVADFDKPARTRILEREVQKGVHEKVQGGYGKYQGQLPYICSKRALPIHVAALFCGYWKIASIVFLPTCLLHRFKAIFKVAAVEIRRERKTY